MTTLGDTVAIFLLLGLMCLGGMFLNFRRIARYNREVYPRLHWNWEHTYICSAADGSASSPRSYKPQANFRQPSDSDPEQMRLKAEFLKWEPR